MQNNHEVSWRSVQWFLRRSLHHNLQHNFNIRVSHSFLNSTMTSLKSWPTKYNYLVLICFKLIAHPVQTVMLAIIITSRPSNFHMFSSHKPHIFVCGCFCPVICEGWHFTHMWKALAWPHHFTKRGGLGHKSSLTTPLLIEVPAPFFSFYSMNV